MPIHEAAGVLGFKRMDENGRHVSLESAAPAFQDHSSISDFHQPVGVWLLVILPAGEVDPAGVVVIRVG